MKKITIVALIFATVSLSASAQSDTFIKFRDKFGRADDVFTLRTNGFWMRAALSLAGEPEAKHALRNIESIRMISVPKDAFEAANVTVAGFRKVVRADAYDELVNIREDGSDVTFYQCGKSGNLDGYLILIEDRENVLLLEVSGYVDVDYLKTLCKDEKRI